MRDMLHGNGQLWQLPELISESCFGIPLPALFHLLIPAATPLDVLVLNYKDPELFPKGHNYRITPIMIRHINSLLSERIAIEELMTLDFPDREKPVLRNLVQLALIGAEE